MNQSELNYMISMYVGGINHDTGDHPGGDNFLSDLIDGRDTQRDKYYWRKRFYQVTSSCLCKEY